MTRPLLMLLCALLLLTAAGCGGDDGDGGDDRGAGVQTLSKPEYVRRFNTIVNRAQGDDSPAKGTDDQQRLDLGLQIYERMADQLAALVPPREARTAHADFVAGLKAVFGLQRQLFDAVKAGDRATIKRVTGDTKSPAAAQDRIERARQFFDAKGYAIRVAPVTAATDTPTP